jgi:hypothetical protein
VNKIWISWYEVCVIGDDECGKFGTELWISWYEVCVIGDDECGKFGTEL